jgi:integrase
MGRQIPKYRLHKGSGQALVELNGRRIYLGRFGTESSKERYRRALAEWLEKGSSIQRPPGVGAEATTLLSINELILRYWRHTEQYYRQGDEPTGEQPIIRAALWYLRELYGLTPAAEFGPQNLKSVRQAMIDAGLSRRVINGYISRVRRMFRWAVENELLRVTVAQALATVPGLSRGRTSAREKDPIQPVADEHIEAVLPHVSPQVATLVQLQRITGMRPSEVVSIRKMDLDMSSDIWVYAPRSHKNQWRGHERRVPLGPRAQQLLQPYLARSDDSFLFSPQEAEATRAAQRRDARKSRMTPSQAGRRPQPNRKRPPRDRYDRDSYRRAVKYGIVKANRTRKEEEKIPDWCPLQLRHTRATEVRKQYGLDSAQTYLGHKNADVTQIYAERDLSAAVRIARESG